MPRATWNNAKTLMSKYGDIICKQGVNFSLRRDIDNELLIGSYCYALAILHEVVAPLDLAFVVEISCLAHTLPAADAAQRKVGNVSLRSSWVRRAAEKAMHEYQNTTHFHRGKSRTLGRKKTRENSIVLKALRLTSATPSPGSRVLGHLSPVLSKPSQTWQKCPRPS